MSKSRFLTSIIALAVLALTAPAAATPAFALSLAFGSDIQICPSPIQPATLSHPTTITDCTRAGVQAALDPGGEINFNCGPGETTILIDQTLELSTHTSTVLDGVGLVTLDGGGNNRILHKGWHDPSSAGEITITIQNLRLVNGKAPSGAATGDNSGGAISSGYSGTRLHIINSTFENNSTREFNTTDNQGGAIFSHNSYETVISGSLFRDNRAGNGGAIGGIATGMLIYNSVFSGNQAQDSASGGIVRGYGGALHLDGVANSGNPDSNKTLQVCGSLFENNTSVRGGGAVSAVVSDNLGTKATFDRSIFTNNAATGIPDPNKSGDYLYGQGGAIYHVEDDPNGGVNEDNFEIRASTFHGNQACKQGGAVWVYILGKGSVVNTTFEANQTSAPFNTVGQGGAMAITLGRFDIRNTTFANNHAAYQAGALHGGGSGDPNLSVTLANTIFYNNTLNEQDLPTPTKWQGYHTNQLMQDGGQNIQFPQMKPTYNNDVNNNITANPIFADPQLAPLASNGGPTQTMGLLAGSPAIDAGNPGACPSFDQRGYNRQGACDIGPFEFAGFLFLPDNFLYLPNIWK